MISGWVEGCKSPSAGVARLDAGGGRSSAKAISVKAHTALLVFSLAFFVAPPVT
ncbi:hypothetical protein [Halochromatium glycolicum]|jgi:hypothetical protein|uniref:hypothetical protein n=1 Tax=Halochromatium glycolicum TaxID=85075 RepID=UPI0019098CB0|nr:hypothetical protein [Halochromatium glycolicum]